MACESCGLTLELNTRTQFRTASEYTKSTCKKAKVEGLNLILILKLGGKEGGFSSMVP